MSGQSVENGKLVSIVYCIRDTSGNVLEQSNLPVSYIYGGKDELIGGLDDAVVGKHAGDSVELALSADQGIGPRDPSLTFTDAIENVPPEYHHVGAEVEMRSQDGGVKTFYVTKIDNGRLTVDGNHPYAGREVRVTVEIKEVRDPTRDEISQYGLSSVASTRLH